MESITQDPVKRYAKTIDNIHICHTCDYPHDVCPSNYHYYGSCQSLRNRTEYRSTHCRGDIKCGYHDVEIIIDDNTKRE